MMSETKTQTFREHCDVDRWCGGDYDAEVVPFMFVVKQEEGWGANVTLTIAQECMRVEIPDLKTEGLRRLAEFLVRLSARLGGYTSAPEDDPPDRAGGVLACVRCGAPMETIEINEVQDDFSSWARLTFWCGECGAAASQCNRLGDPVPIDVDGVKAVYDPAWGPIEWRVPRRAVVDPPADGA